VLTPYQGTPDDIAKAVVSSPPITRGFINAHVLPVDGGLLAHHADLRASTRPRATTRGVRRAASLSAFTLRQQSCGAFFDTWAREHLEFCK